MQILPPFPITSHPGFSQSQTSQTGQPTAPTTDNGKTPFQNVIDTYTEVYKQLGLTDIKTAYEKTLKDQQDMTDKMNAEIADVNDDPWLSQGVRDARVKKIQTKYETKLNTLSNFAKLYDSEFQQGQEQAKFLVGQIETDTQKAVELAQKKQEALDALSNTPDIKEYQVAQGQGYSGTFLQYQKEVANLKNSGNSSLLNGLTANQINSTVNQIAQNFDNEPVVKQYNTIAETVAAVKNAGTAPTDDIQRIYAFAKVMDPNSAVREGEYKTVQEYSTSLLQRVGLNANRVFNNDGFLTDEARTFINTTLQNRLNSSYINYQNVYNQYQQRVQQAKAGGGNSITDYSQAFNPTTPPPPSGTIVSKGTLSDKAFVEKALTANKLSYASVTGNVPQGQIPVLDNATGQPGYIPVSEYTSNKYTKL